MKVEPLAVDINVPNLSTKYFGSTQLFPLAISFSMVTRYFKNEKFPRISAEMIGIVTRNPQVSKDHSDPQIYRGSE